MKFKEKLNQAAGFTLVELIVVIAILAILAGVAVPAYSGYITQANKSADQSLVADISQALQLQYYSSTGDVVGGWVKLTADGATADSTGFGAAAMEAAFGPNWQQTAKLKWDGWKTAPTFTSALGMSQADANAVITSNYVSGGVETAISNVASLTDTALGFLVKKLDDPNYTYANMYSAMALNFAGNDKAAFAEMCKEHGIAVNEDGTSFDESTDRETLQNQLSNLMVFSTAGEYADYYVAEAGATTSIATGLMMLYADYTAAVNSEYGTNAKEMYDQMNLQLAGANSVDQVESILSAFGKNPTVAAMMEAYSENEEMLDTDATALYNIMKTVDNASANLSANDLASNTLFASDGKIADAFGGYVSSAGMVASGLFDQNLSVADGEIIVYLYAANDGSIKVDASSAMN